MSMRYAPIHFTPYEKYAFHRNAMKDILSNSKHAYIEHGTEAYESYCFHEMQAALNNLPGFYDHYEFEKRRIAHTMKGQ